METIPYHTPSPEPQGRDRDPATGRRNHREYIVIVLTMLLAATLGALAYLVLSGPTVAANSDTSPPIEQPFEDDSSTTGTVDSGATETDQAPDDEKTDEKADEMGVDDGEPTTPTEPNPVPTNPGSTDPGSTQPGAPDPGGPTGPAPAPTPSPTPTPPAPTPTPTPTPTPEPPGPFVCAIGYSPNAAGTDCVFTGCPAPMVLNGAGVCMTPKICKVGYTWNADTDVCDFTGCPFGQVLNPFGTCVVQISCIEGYELSEDWTECVFVGCPFGKFLNDDGFCEDFGFAPICDTDEELVDGECLPKCAPNEFRLGKVCVEFGVIDPTPICKVGEVLIGGECVGWMFDPDIEFEVNPDLLPDSGDLLKP